MLYIGVDLGTSSVKLVLMDETGDIKKIVSEEYPLYFPKTGWSEQNPSDWYEKFTQAVKDLTKDCDKSQIDGISFSGQMHGLVILDENDEVIRPAILWNDGREHGADRLHRSEASVGEEARAGEFREDPKDHAAEGLSGVPSWRRTLHGCLGCLGHAAAGCEEQMLVKGNA